jgi:hypothetical protein
MHYEINVSHHGVHLFATHERSLQQLYKAEELMSIFSQKFPRSEGYHVSCTEWRSEGKIIAFG